MKTQIDLPSLIISLVALFIAYRTYVRQKTMENENHIYKYNLERYFEILTQISELNIFMEDIMDKLYYNKDYYNYDDEANEKLVDEFDKKVDNFDLEIYAKAALLPEKVITSIDNFITTLYTIDFLPTAKIDSYNQTLQKIMALSPAIDKIEESMRDDLHIETLNSKMNSRLQSVQRRRDRFISKSN